MKLFFIAAILFYLSASGLATKKSDWEEFKEKYNRTYTNPAEDAMRQGIFQENQAAIDLHNSEYDRGESTFRMRMNQYGDMTTEQWNKLINGYSTNNRKPEHVNTKVIVDTVDWRHRSFVTGVKNQRECASCWAFSVAGSTESIHCIKTGELVELSEQQLIDCPYNKTLKGRCDIGGYTTDGFQSIIMKKGIDTSASYPYEMRSDTPCRFDATNVGAKITTYVGIPSGDESCLRDAVAQQPVSVIITFWNDMDTYSSLMFYKSGIYNNPNCSASTEYHAVLCVGYGTDSESEEEYWLLKNSYGVTWGDAGYFKLARNENNMCDIASYANYPVV